MGETVAGAASSERLPSVNGLRVSLFGGVTASLDGRALAPPRSGAAWALLAWLALHPGRHRRAGVAAVFWPDSLDRSARGNLRTALWALRGVVGDCVVVERDRIGLDAWVDARAFDALCAAGREVDALALARGDLLAGLEEEWALLARDQHRERYCELAAATGSVAWARRAAALDPLAEAPQRVLIERLAATGDVPAALGAHTRFAERLRRQLGVAPSASLRARVEELREASRAPARPARDAGAPEAAAEAPAGAVPRGRAGEPRLIGRASELETLRSAWTAAVAGRGGVAIVEGEAGTGKTRLVAELQREAPRVASGAALPFGGGVPLSLWAELLRDLLRDGRPPAALVGECARLVPELGTPSPAPAAFERARLYEAVVGVVAWACVRSPLLLVLEDLHDADAASVELAGYLARRLETLPALLVLTRREHPRAPNVDAVVHALRSRGLLTAELALRPLPDDAAARLARSVAVLDAEQVASVVAGAEGNALLAVEGARALAAGERTVPATLRAAVRVTARGLPAEVWRLVELAAAAGRPLDPATLAALPVTDDAAVRALDCGLLVEHDHGVGFRHALLRDAVYADLPAPRRAWAHTRIAEALGSTLAGERARHLRLAGRDELAVAELVRAAAAARGMAALAEAEAFLTEAVEIVPRDASLLLELAEVQAWAGRGDRALASLERALAATAPDQQAGAHLRAGAWLRGAVCDPRAALTHYRAALDAGGDRAAALAGSAWCVAVAGDPAQVETLLAEVAELADERVAHDIESARGLALLRRGHFAEAVEPLLAGAELAAERPDLAYTSWVNATVAASASGDFERALEISSRALTVVGRFNLVGLALQLHAARGHLLSRLGRHAEGLAAMAEQARLADRLDDPALRALADNDAGLARLAAGDFAGAEACLARALDGAGAISRPLARLARAEALAALGRADEADAELRATVVEPVGTADAAAMLAPRFARVQGLVAAARGDSAEAERRLREALAGWDRRVGLTEVGRAWVASIVDLGRPPVVGLIEPERERARLLAELAAL
ncbi:AAA family ATPase [Solirubrobacter phytolaccae]|uniref:AAA family ATPase n=1 Tax=Solirubrobacter phytolaccae TaxID=1404360 RepID=A0A9X3S700_9ACTN|nr:AAA family ATPase [Solirubrobacter phytolaccae]MDA0179718.1 AAA family ATPase [Solirubrobacter phytolaccae]